MMHQAAVVGLYPSTVKRNVRGTRRSTRIRRGLSPAPGAGSAKGAARAAAPAGVGAYRADRILAAVHFPAGGTGRGRCRCPGVRRLGQGNPHAGAALGPRSHPRPPLSVVSGGSVSTERSPDSDRARAAIVAGHGQSSPGECRPVAPGGSALRPVLRRALGPLSALDLLQRGIVQRGIGGIFSLRHVVLLGHGTGPRRSRRFASVAVGGRLLSRRPGGHHPSADPFSLRAHPCLVRLVRPAFAAASSPPAAACSSPVVCLADSTGDAPESCRQRHLDPDPGQ